MRALILAAGLGERLRPYTFKRAKPAIEFLNVPMLGYPVHWLLTLNLDQIVFNTHYLPETVRHAAHLVCPPNIPLHFTFEHEILGSGGGIWNARFQLQNGEDFAVANADGVVAFSRPHTLQLMLENHRAQNALATLLVCPLIGVGTRIPGVWFKPDGTVVGFGKEKAEFSGSECQHYASYMILSPRLWSRLPEGPSNILYDVLSEAMADGERVQAFRVEDMRWFETGATTDYLDATWACLDLIHADGPLGRGLKELIQKRGPRSTRDTDWSLGRLVADSAKLDVRQLHGRSVVGDEAQVGPHLTLKDCVVLNQAVVTTSGDRTIFI